MRTRTLLTLGTAVAAALACCVMRLPFADAAELSFVRVVNGYNGPAAVNVAVGDAAPAPLTWAAATPWLPVNAASERLEVDVAGGATDITIRPPAGCSTTVILAKASPADSQPTSIMFSYCDAGRIAAGNARITAVASTVDELGPVAFRIGGQERVVEPRQSLIVSLDVPGGPGELAVGTPGTGEVYQRTESQLEPDATYTLLYLGGGETPARLVLLEDGRQASAPPPPDVPINTGVIGQLADSGIVAVGLLRLASLFAFALAWRPLHRQRLRTGHASRLADRSRPVGAVLGLVLLLCAGCGVPLTSPREQGPTGAGTGDPPLTTSPGSGGTSAAGPGDTGSMGGPGEEVAPVKLTIPSLQETFTLVPFSTADVSRLPKSLPLEQVAWLAGSSRLGEPGTTAVIGHTTAPGRMPAPFNHLADLRQGQRFQMTGQNQVIYDYTVVAVEVAPKGYLPDTVFEPRPVSTVVLITCTDAGSGPVGSYTDNLIITGLLGTTGRANDGSPNP